VVHSVLAVCRQDKANPLSLGNRLAQRPDAVKAIRPIPRSANPLCWSEGEGRNIG
jgi:hypothetical protein